RALPIASARLRAAAPDGAASFDETIDVDPSDRGATFRLPLPAGPFDLQSWFLDGEGRELCGAYYVYARRVQPMN
ncbi:MAG: hypothetical protein EBZ59_06315, partial [Planctomycetia bacterium]|nr:hypothetical protein [Planctomycetia bacterium]